MADKVKKVAIQLSLDVDKQGAIAQVKGVTEQMKKILASFEKSGGSFEVFQNLVSYLGDVEQKILELKNISPIKFDELFGEQGGAALNSTLQSQIAETLKTAEQLPGIIANIQKKIDGLKGQKTIKISEIREVGEDIKSLYSLMGQTPKVDLDFAKQKGSLDKLDILSDALKDFKVDWLDFVNTIKDNPNPLNDDSKTTGSGKNPEIEAINKKIEDLKAQKQALTEALNIFSEEQIEFKFKEGKELLPQMKELVAEFRKAETEKKKLETNNLTNTDEYLEAVKKYIYAAKLLSTAGNTLPDNAPKAVADYMVSDEGYKAFNEADRIFENTSIQQNLKAYIQQIVDSYKNGIKEIDTEIEKLQNDIKSLENLSATSGNSGKVEENKKTAISYDELSNKLKEYLRLQEKVNNGDELDDNGEKIDDKIATLENYFDSLANTKEELDKIQGIIGDFSFGDINLDEVIKQLSEFMNIINSSQTSSVFPKISGEIENTTQRVMYHLGNLLDGLGEARDTFGDMLDNLTKTPEGTRFEKYGFGVLGGGLFGVTNPSTMDVEPGGAKFIQSIDLSKYNMYMADTEERAIALMEFLSKLQKFSIKSAEPNYTGFDEQLNGANVDSLYGQFKTVFDQSELTKEQFESFINEMVSMLKQAGLVFDKQTNELDFTNLTDNIANTENISTRFMKMLGYQGVNVGETSFDGFGQGSVLFDFDKSDIVGYFSTIEQAMTDFKNIQSQINGEGNWIGSTEQLQQYANNIDDIIKNITNLGRADQALDTTLSKLREIQTTIQNILQNNGNRDADFAKIGADQKTSSFTDSGQGSGNGNGNGQSVDLTGVTNAIQGVSDVIKSESGNIQSKIDAINPSEVLNGISDTVKSESSNIQSKIDEVNPLEAINNVQISVDNLANKDDTDSKQQQIDTITQNLTDITNNIQDISETIKSESGNIQSKIDTINPSETLNGIQTTLNNIQNSVDNFANKDNSTNKNNADPKQQQIDAMKKNLLEFAKIQKDTNDKIINDKYQGQELSGSIFSNGKIKLNKGEDGSVPWSKFYELFLSEAASAIGDIHTHPFDQIQSTIKKLMNDSFSFASGDISAYRQNKRLDVQMSGMLTGDIYRILDISKVSIDQMNQLVAALKINSAEYTKKYPNYVQYKNGTTYLGQNFDKSLPDNHILSELREQILLKSLDDAGISRDIFQKYDIKNDEDLTKLATTLVDLGNAAKQVTTPFDRMLQIFGTYNKDIASVGQEIQEFVAGNKTITEFAHNMVGGSEQAWEKFLNADFSKYQVGDANSIQAFKSLFPNGASKSIFGLDDNTTNKMIDIMSSQQDQSHKLLSIFDTLAKSGGYATQLYDTSVAYKKGERSIYDIFNSFSGKYGLTFDKINPNAQDSITTIDYQNSLSPLEQAINEISSLLSSISSAVNAIQQNTNQTTVQSLDKLKESILTFNTNSGDKSYFNSFVAKLGNKSQYDPNNITEYYTKQVVQNADEAIRTVISNFNRVDMLGIENIDNSSLTDMVRNFQNAISVMYDAMNQVNSYQEAYDKTISGDAAVNAYTGEVVDYSDVINYLAQMFNDFTSTNINNSAANNILPIIDELKSRLDTTRTTEENHVVDNTAQDQLVGEILPLLQNINEALNNLTNIFSSGELRVQQVDQNNNSVNKPVVNNDQQNTFDSANVNLANSEDVSALQNEQQILLSLEQIILRVKDAVDAKTQAFENEKSQVETNINSEIETLKGFEDVVIRVKDTIMSISTELGTVQSVNLIQNIEQEITNCDNLKAKIVEIRDAIDEKTQAFVTEKETVASVVAEEIDSLTKLKEYIESISQSISELINGKLVNMSDKITSEIDKTKDTDTKKTKKTKDVSDTQPEDTSSKVNLPESDKLLSDISDSVHSIVDIMKGDGLFTGIKEPLNNISQKLDKLVNGSSDNKNTGELPSGSANTRLADSKQYDQIKEIALGAVSDRGTESKITGMKALADGLVQVNGYIKTAEGNYENFVVKVNEANETIGLAFSDNKKLTQQMQAEAAAQEAFSNNFNLVADEFVKYTDSIDQSDQVTAKFSNQIQQMESRLATVSNGAELDAWKADWDALTTSIAAAKQEQEKLILEGQKRKDTGTLNSVDKSATEIYKSLKIDPTKMTPELEEIRKKYLDIVSVIAEYKKKRDALTEDEVNGLKQAEAELQKMAQAYAQKQQAEQKQKEDAQKAYGASQVKNIGKKYTQLSGVASGAEFADSSTVQSALSTLEASYQKLVDKQKEFIGIDPTDEQKKEFAQLTDQYNQAYRALDNIIKSSRKLQEQGIGDPYEIEAGTDMSDENVRMQELQEAVKYFSNGTAEVGKFNKEFTELSYTVKNADGTFTDFTAILDKTGTKIVNVSGKTKEATSFFKGAFDAIRKKSKEILAYMVSMGGLSRVIGQLKQGIQYVKEIDSALTELKKVTNETDAVYKRFLQTASQAGSEIGTTIADFTNATADFARLGYTITEATDLAKAASIYKNVGDGINSVSDASESIISTMKAFGIEASDAMGIVDRFNEVGNNFAISSTGIGEALQRSASALYESGNTIDESIALITAANSVVQNPETVG